MKQKINTPKGTRDFSSEEITKREYIFDVIKLVFKKFGFQPIETPCFENLSTLTDKYGEEGDKLIFKILNSGDYLKKVDDKIFLEKNSAEFTKKIADKALRYDLTIPFARYVVQHQNEIIFPFKRYQIQPVWRADRPQKGRFREFYQCDADVVGSTSIWQEIEFIQLYDEVFTHLKLENTTIKINSRKVLSGIAEIIGAKDKLIDITIALDKIDKIGKTGVIEEMKSKGISNQSIEKISPLFDFEGDNFSKLKKLEEMLSASKEGIAGIEDLRFIVEQTEELELHSSFLKIDVTLARGLDYYTGSIIEVEAPKEVSMGAIGGGGRYDDLTGSFGLKNISGVGISFGLDRIYLVLDELKLLEEKKLTSPKVLFLNFGNKETIYCMKAIKKMRRENINCEFYPDNSKLKKQMSYADKRKIRFVVLVGEKEIKNKKWTLKNMISGEQIECNFEELIQKIK